MSQHVGLQSETEDGEPIADFADGKSIDLRILDFADERGHCVRFIDPYGDTIFNQIQLPALIAELEAIRSKTDDSSFKANVTSVIDFLRTANGVHIYVRFVGD